MENGNTGRLGISRKAADSSVRVMNAVKAGKIRLHLIGNTSPVRYGTMEKKEMADYLGFIRTKLCYEIMNLPGEKKEEPAEEDEEEGKSEKGKG